MQELALTGIGLLLMQIVVQTQGAGVNERCTRAQ